LRSGRTRCGQGHAQLSSLGARYRQEISQLAFVNAEWVATRTELLREVWGYQESVISRTLDTHVGELRRKLEEDPGRPRHILTVRKTGYRLAVGN